MDPQFSTPVLISRQLGTHGSFLGLLAALPIAGLHPLRSANPVLAQLQDQRKSPESATEMSMVNGWGNLHV